MSYLTLRRLVAVAVFLVAGCGDSTGPNGPEGTYRLDRVNGSTLPFLAEQFGTFRIDILSGSLTLRADHSFSAAITSRQTDGSNAQTLTEQGAGSWSASGASITFSETAGAAYSGQVSGGRLTAQRSGVTFEFVRQ